MDNNTVNINQNIPSFTGDNAPNVNGGVGSDSQVQPGQVVARPDVEVTPNGSTFKEGAGQITKPHHVFQSIMETLAGPQFQYKINPNTGQQEKVPIQRTKSQLANSIVAGALTGLFAGAGEHGPNAFSRGLGKGGQAAVAMRENADQQAQQQAKDDYARRTVIFENNLRMHQNQLNIANMDYAIHEKLAQDDNALYDEMKDIPGFFTTGEMSEQEALKFDPTLHNVIRRRVVENGKNPDGTPHYEHTYIGVNPNAVADVPDGLIADAKKWGFLPENFPSDWRTKAYMMSNAREKIASADVMNHVLSTFAKGYTIKTGKPLVSPELPVNIASLVDNAAKKYDIQPALLRGLVSVESNGNPDAISDKGAIGLGQVMPATAKGYGVTADQLKDPTTNIDVSAHYLRDLLDKHNNDPKLALASYHGIGSDGHTTDSQYVKKISNLIGLDNKDEFKTKSFEVANLEKALKSDPTLIKAVAKFPFGIAANNGVGAALDGMQKLEDAGKIPTGYTAKVTNLFGAENVREMVQHQEIEKKAQQQAADTQARLDVENSPEAQAAKIRLVTGEKEAKDALDNAQQAEQRKVLERPANYDSEILPFLKSPEAKKMEFNELANWLQSKGVKVPDIFANLYAAGNYAMSPDTYSARVWAKGSKGEMDKQTAYSYIKQFINPDFNERTYTVLKQLDNPNSKENQNIQAFNQLFDHIGSALEANEKYHRLDGGQMLNKPISWWKQNMSGDPVVTNLEVALAPVKNEFMTFLKGNYALTDHDAKVSDALALKDMKVSTLEEALKKFAETAAYRIKEEDNKIYSLTRKHIPGLVSSDAVKAVGKMTDDKGNNRIADIIGDLDTGGFRMGGEGGLGQPGQTINQSLGRVPNEQPVYINNKLVGYTVDGKTISRAIGQ